MDDSLHFETPIFKLRFESSNKLLNFVQLLGLILVFYLWFYMEHHKIFFSSLFVIIIKLMKSMLQFELNLDLAVQNSNGFQFSICLISIF
jgi:hypothetical protein